MLAEQLLELRIGGEDAKAAVVKQCRRVKKILGQRPLQNGVGALKHLLRRIALTELRQIDGGIKVFRPVGRPKLEPFFDDLHRLVGAAKLELHVEEPLEGHVQIFAVGVGAVGEEKALDFMSFRVAEAFQGLARFLVVDQKDALVVPQDAGLSLAGVVRGRLLDKPFLILDGALVIGVGLLQLFLFLVELGEVRIAVDDDRLVAGLGGKGGAQGEAFLVQLFG